MNKLIQTIAFLLLFCQISFAQQKITAGASVVQNITNSYPFQYTPPVVEISPLEPVSTLTYFWFTSESNTATILRIDNPTIQTAGYVVQDYNANVQLAYEDLTGAKYFLGFNDTNDQLAYGSYTRYVNAGFDCFEEGTFQVGNGTIAPANYGMTVNLNLTNTVSTNNFQIQIGQLGDLNDSRYTTTSQFQNGAITNPTNGYATITQYNRSGNVISIGAPGSGNAGVYTIVLLATSTNQALAYVYKGIDNAPDANKLLIGTATFSVAPAPAANLQPTLAKEYWPLRDGNQLHFTNTTSHEAWTLDTYASQTTNKFQLAYYNDLVELYFYEIGYAQQQSAIGIQEIDAAIDDPNNTNYINLNGQYDLFDFPVTPLISDSTIANGGSTNSLISVFSWNNGTNFVSKYTNTVTKIGAVSVPAGTFKNCVQATYTSPLTQPLTIVFAPNVGPIEVGTYAAGKLTGYDKLVSGTVNGQDIKTLPSYTAPAVTVANPLNNSVNSNGIAIYSGTASSANGIASIWGQLNNNYRFQCGTSTNWNTQLRLTPGTNTIETYAVDKLGNISPAVITTVKYVVSAPLTIQIIGSGTISPNYSNAWLEIGKSYSITSAPTVGFVFTNWVVSTNWIGGTTVTNKSLSFSMVSNLTLQATFLDVTKPTISITTPTNLQKMTNALATIIGTANDNWKITNVWYRLNGGTWSSGTTANGFTNWTSALLPLSAGTNSLNAYAVDLAGNFSATNSVSFVSSNTFKLQMNFALSQSLTTNGASFSLQISPGLNGHIQVSTNLATWTTLTNFVGTNTTLNFHDPSATNSHQRFYRAVIP